jgi:hypothetical protein
MALVSSPPRLGRPHAIRRIFFRAYTLSRIAGDVSTCFKCFVLNPGSCLHRKALRLYRTGKCSATDNLALLVSSMRLHHPHNKPATRLEPSNHFHISVVQPRRASGLLCDRKPKVSFVKLSRQMIWSEQGGWSPLLGARGWVVGTLKCTAPSHQFLKIQYHSFGLLPRISISFSTYYC